MLFKLTIIVAVITIVQGGIFKPAAVANPITAAVSDSEYDPNPHYNFGYNVHDSLTGDSKSQVESRRGDVVHGSYSLNDPDGTRRTVDYSADPINGFNAVVRRTPLGPNQALLVPSITPLTHLVKELPSVVIKSNKEISDHAPVSSAASETPISSSLDTTSGSIIRTNPHFATHLITQIGLPIYSIPLVSHLTYAGGTYGYGNSGLYSRYPPVHYF